MKSSALIVRVTLASLIVGVGASASNVEAAPASNVEKDSAVSWDRATAAHYLDSREIWWQMWPDTSALHDTICVSCHTVLPYALARPALRQQMRSKLAGPERIMFNNVVKRVTLWNDVEPFYKDGKAGPTKSIESRGTEAVLNALILANYDARSGHLTEEVTRTAFGNAWALQRHSGDNTGRLDMAQLPQRSLGIERVGILGGNVGRACCRHCSGSLLLRIRRSKAICRSCVPICGGNTRLNRW